MNGNYEAFTSFKNVNVANNWLNLTKSDTSM